MAVEILMLANDGEAGREKGAIINIQECEEGGKIKWGSAECPPYFKIVRMDGVMKKDIDAKLLEFGGHRSRMKLDEKLLAAEAVADLSTGKTPVITHTAVVSAMVDKGVEWMPKVAVEAIEEPIAP